MIDPQNDHLKAASGNQIDIRQVFGDELRQKTAFWQ
jgi:hypothetical protein